ncbi:MAG: prephenate dehydrogenase [Lachnospiraceae bacterium]|nr:prephenate dehydrogenase [Lachnospiraceae bacterium]
MKELKIGFIGLGLIGGSIAKKLKQVCPDIFIVAYNRSEQSRIDALNDKIANIATDTIDDNFKDCNYIFLCTPVEQNIKYLSILRDIISPECIITDVGSVKGNIHKEIESLSMTKNFIGGHPMAGSEKTGYRNASTTLLENAYYAITPTKDTDKEKLNEFYKLIETLKAIPVILDCDEHDYAVAAISHVPHLIAASLVNLVKDNDSDKETMKLLAAGGFKDITRIASSSPIMWQQICSTNKENITNLIDKYIKALEQVKENVLEEGSKGVFDLFEKSKEYRNSFSDKSHGPIKKGYKIYCDIVDESGSISKIATLLALSNINIMNIGIVHNREFDEGVLKIEFYDQNSMEDAIEILSKFKYQIYVHN